jgi:hypothetical protein
LKQNELDKKAAQRLLRGLSQHPTLSKEMCRLRATSSIALTTTDTLLVRISTSFHPSGAHMRVMILPPPKIYHLYAPPAAPGFYLVDFKVVYWGWHEPHHHRHNFVDYRYSWHHLLLCLGRDIKILSHSLLLKNYETSPPFGWRAGEFLLKYLTKNARGLHPV